MLRDGHGSVKTLGEAHGAVRAAVSCHLSYVALEHHGGQALYVARTGTTRAWNGLLGIIRSWMGARSYIVRGLGSPDPFESAAHGTGERISRAQAKAMLDAEDVALRTEVMESQRDLVEIVETLKHLVCVKG